MSKDGGLAFPSVEYGEGGMTLRDWMAGMALVGLISQGRDAQLIVSGAGSLLVPMADVAQESYEYADAMLAAREVPHE